MNSYDLMFSCDLLTFRGEVGVPLVFYYFFLTNQMFSYDLQSDEFIVTCHHYLK